MTESIYAQPAQTPELLTLAGAASSPRLEFKDAKPGIYFMWDSSGKLLYVGQSKFAAYRCGQHALKGWQFETITWQAMEERFLETYEREYIFRLAPPLNKRGQSRATRAALQIGRYGRHLQRSKRV